MEPSTHLKKRLLVVPAALFLAFSTITLLFSLEEKGRHRVIIVDSLGNAYEAVPGSIDFSLRCVVFQEKGYSGHVRICGNYLLRDRVIEKAKSKF